MVGGHPGRRSELVEAAFRRIADGGLEGLRLRAVAEDVGIDHSTLHHHVATKSDLITGVVAHTLRRFRMTMGGDGDAVTRLDDHLSQLGRLLTEDPALFVVTAELDLLARRDPAVRAAIERQEAGWRAALVALFQDGLRSGVVTDPVDPSAAAELVIATVKGVRLTPEHARSAFDQLETLLRAPRRESRSEEGEQ